MSSESFFPPSTLFQMSRIGAGAIFGDMKFQVDLASQSGPGVRLFTRCHETEISLWCPEQTWCSWLMPQLSTSGIEQIEEELRPVIASWTLDPFNRWLEQEGLPNLINATVAVCSVNEPSQCWRLTLIHEDRRLSLYLDHVPPEILTKWLAAMVPSSSQMHTLTLILGWCTLPLDEIDNIAIGDALHVIGIGPDLDRFWLHALDIPEQVQLKDSGNGVVTSSPHPCSSLPESTARFTVEAGKATLDAATLASWSPGMNISLLAHPYMLLQLQWEEKLWAQGTLVRLDDGWAVRIVSLGKTGLESSQ